MVIENQIPKTEMVYEIKNEYKVPSFEEFMQSYENDDNLNYDDLNDGDISEAKGYGPCSYSSYEVNPNKVAGRHINMCGSFDCSYYCRITSNRIGGAAGITTSVGAGIGFYFGALALSPFTGGASLVAAAAVGSATSVGIAAGGTALTVVEMTETLKDVENELRLKWEEEKRTEERAREREREREREKSRKINSLQNQLNDAKRELERAIEKMDMCKSDSDYTREKNEKERLENKVRNLKRDLCREKGCNCGGYYCL